MFKKSTALFTVAVLLAASALTGCGEELKVTETEVRQSETEVFNEAETAGQVTEEQTEPIADFDLNALSEFEVTSEDLHDGVWDSVITFTENGSNVSPQLSWNPVEGAASYTVYMIDTSAGNWMHWKSGGITETSLPQGWAGRREYKGPYPPEGTHDYEIYVLALKNTPESADGSFNSANLNFFQKLGELDSMNCDGGNIISYGHITGTYTHGD